MLNAFRHHGLFRRLTQSVTDTTLKCSTPSASRIISAVAPLAHRELRLGAQRLSASRIISGWRPIRRSRPRRWVLNAFRHHGLFRVETAGDIFGGAIRCSTPFGITDYFGVSRLQVVVPRPLSAQRLSASRIISGTPSARRCAGSVGAQRLSGITDYFGSRLPPTRRKVIGAQRLSASRIISVQLPVSPVVHPVMVLNAFRHHGLFRWPEMPQVRQRMAVLNAFRHHGLFRACSMRLKAVSD